LGSKRYNAADGLADRPLAPFFVPKLQEDLGIDRRDKLSHRTIRIGIAGQVRQLGQALHSRRDFFLNVEVTASVHVQLPNLRFEPLLFGEQPINGLTNERAFTFRLCT
jgi:hypothetical protein